MSTVIENISVVSNFEQTLEDVTQSRVPIFELSNLDNDKHLKVFFNGQVEGFDLGEGRTGGQNLIPEIVLTLSARANYQCRKDESPDNQLTESGSGVVHDSQE